MARMPAAVRREELVRAAIVVVARDGLHAATTRRIVAEAGMSLASFHYAFDSRDELIEELVRRVVKGTQGAVMPEQLAGGDLADVLEAGFVRYFEHVRGEPEFELALLEITQWALRSPGHRALAELQHRTYRDLAVRALETAAAVSGARWRIPVSEAAPILVAFTEGMTTTWLVDRDDAAALRVARAAADALSRLAEPA